MQKARIWEIDAFRGFFILAMVVVHLVYDLQNFFFLPIFTQSRLYALAAKWGGTFFFLISGISATLGVGAARRGLQVLCFGLGISAVTAMLYILGLAQRDILIYFGVLHCLGVSMMLWSLFRHMSVRLLAVAAAAIVGVGLLLMPLRFSTGFWLMPLGFVPKDFVSADYFPLLPFFGFFLTGAFLGKTLYKHKKTLFPRISADHILIRFLCCAGRNSLWIYILHQPLLLGTMYAWEAIL